MKQLFLFRACYACKTLKYRYTICTCAAERKKKYNNTYYKNHKEEIIKKAKDNRKRRYKNEKKYRRTEKGKAATNRAYINQILKGSK